MRRPGRPMVEASAPVPRRQLLACQCGCAFARSIALACVRGGSTEYHGPQRLASCRGSIRNAGAARGARRVGSLGRSRHIERVERGDRGRRREVFDPVERPRHCTSALDRIDPHTPMPVDLQRRDKTLLRRVGRRLHEMSFTARRIALSSDDDVKPTRLVYRYDEVRQLRDVTAAVERARRAAAAMVAHARQTASSMDAGAAAARRAREKDAELALITRARALEESYRFAHASLTRHIEATLDAVLTVALTRLGAAIEPEVRLRIVRDELAKAAGPQPGASLHLCAADASTYCSARLTSPWPVMIDDALAPGCCRLASDHGEWSLDFDALMASLCSPAPIGTSDANASTDKAL